MTDKWILCIKHGEKYSSIYVNKLYNMVKRHCSVPFKFACITENPSGLNKDIEVLNFPMLGGTRGWWFKPYMFSKQLPLNGTILYLDLDLVIIDSIDKFWEYEPGKNIILENFKAPKQPTTSDFNSSVIRFTAHELHHIFSGYVANSKSIQEKYHGDQDWIHSAAHQQFITWPKEWAKSYKWEVRTKDELEVQNNKLNFKNIRNPEVGKDTSVLVFHGDPKPHEVDDGVIVENWR